MRKSRFTETQVVKILKEVEGGRTGALHHQQGLVRSGDYAVSWGEPDSAVNWGEPKTRAQNRN